ncbi:hypothetical protein [Gracilimonas mengyeensis]|uniref:Uncharacterized protein n=1 Tax=Gracilimonas mengyeensis TaxID=1302730 RepID=A0A521E437_9BACT|nr:hypothetical protein [Gracilimonas mengyeensis]SMO78697.1 hypothetical protein SAMN06265219_110140 [Gracilimonas mengyeensis]
MKESKQHTEHEIKKTMQVLDEMERATTDSFFYSRLQARIENREQTEPRQGWHLEFGFAAAAAIVLIFVSLNVLVLTQSPDILEAEATVDRENFMEQLAADYQVIDPSYYESAETTEEE